jgi:hypothetical protein
MPATPATSQHLQQYVTERLPALLQGGLEVPGDPPSFTVDQRYVPLKDPAYQK